MKLKLITEDTKEEVLTFLDEDLQEFVSKVTKRTKRRWISEYTNEQIEETLGNAYEWCHATNHAPKSVGNLMVKFFKDVKKTKLSKIVAQQLDDLLKEGPDA